MSSTSPKKDGKARVASLDLKGSTKLPQDDAPISGRTAGAQYDAELKLREAEELRNSVQNSMNGLSGEFKDYRRESEASQPAAKQTKQTKRRSDWGRQLTEKAKDAEGDVPAKKPIIDEKNGMHSVELPTEPLTSPKSVPLPSTPRKLGEPAKSPTTPNTKATVPGIAVTTEKPDEPTTPPNKAPGQVTTPSAPQKPVKGPVKDATAATPNLGEVAAALSKKWKEQQKLFGVPNAARLNAHVGEIVRFEDSSRNFEQAMDGDKWVVDPRTSFRKPYPEETGKEFRRNRARENGKEPREEDLEDAADRPPTFYEMMESKIDPRHSFRSGASGVKNWVSKATTRSTATAKSEIDSKTDDLPKPTLALPKTWIEHVLWEYEGSWKIDVQVAIAVVAICFLLPVSIILWYTGSFGQIIGWPCEYPAVRTISSYGPTFYLPDFCVPAEWRAPTTHSVTPSDSPIIMDPLGLGQVLTWPRTLPNLKEVERTISHPIYPFKPINDRLKQSAAYISKDAHVKKLAASGDKRVEALKAVQVSVKDLTNRYDVFANDLVQWSVWAPRDIRNLIEWSTGFWSRYYLNMLFGTASLVAPIKQKLRLPVQELLWDTKLLGDKSDTALYAILNAKSVRDDYRAVLAEAEEYFIEKCLIRSPFLGWTRIRTDDVCRGWDPRVIRKSLVTIERHEHIHFNVMFGHVETISKSVYPLGKFYGKVLQELDHDSMGKTYGNSTLKTLAETRETVEGIEKRTAASAAALKKNLGK